MTSLQTMMKLIMRIGNRGVQKIGHPCMQISERGSVTLNYATLRWSNTHQCAIPGSRHGVAIVADHYASIKEESASFGMLEDFGVYKHTQL